MSLGRWQLFGLAGSPAGGGNVPVPARPALLWAAFLFQGRAVWKGRYFSFFIPVVSGNAAGLPLSQPFHGRWSKKGSRRAAKGLSALVSLHILFWLFTSLFWGRGEVPLCDIVAITIPVSLRCIFWTKLSQWFLKKQKMVVIHLVSIFSVAVKPSCYFGL